MIDIRHGDCIATMRAMDDACVDAIVTDPPYELNFMGKGWDATGIANSVEMWREAYRVLKPGGHLLAFSGTRTQHRMVCAIEDAGFEIRDQIGWMYGSGFPKSLDVSKAIDKAVGAERKVVGSKLGQPGYSLKANDTEDHGRKAYGKFTDAEAECTVTAPATPEAQQWAGWSTALKPAWEPICVARKPLSEKTVAANVLAHGTGAINIDACRVATDEALGGGAQKRVAIEGKGEGWQRPWMHDDNAVAAHVDRVNANVAKAETLGRWPANIIHDGSDDVLEAFAAFGSSKSKSGGTTSRTGDGLAFGMGTAPRTGHDDEGSPARFFYSAKASKADRAGSKHPTVKPISLMRYLCKLVTPPGGTVLDMFAGSGTTLQAALEENFSAIGIEQDETYVNDIRNRIAAAREGLGLFAVAAE